MHCPGYFFGSDQNMKDVTLCNRVLCPAASCKLSDGFSHAPSVVSNTGKAPPVIRAFSGGIMKLIAQGCSRKKACCWCLLVFSLPALEEVPKGYGRALSNSERCMERNSRANNHLLRVGMQQIFSSSNCNLQDSWYVYWLYYLPGSGDLAGYGYPGAWIAWLHIFPRSHWDIHSGNPEFFWNIPHRV